MASSFGKTWWGEQFLHALSDIDFGNRLPRGMRYARNGSVLNTEIDKNTVYSLVKGSQPRPYKIKIEILLFDENDSKPFIKELSGKPLIITKLLNGELDEQILDIALRHSLEVFPQSWSDLKMQCSCPDFAVPCKHLAAVIYKLSEEIDNDPLLIFKLHGMDLIALFKEHGVHIVSDHQQVPTLENLMQVKQSKPKSIKLKNLSIDLSHMPSLLENITRLLADNPTFNSKGNFREKYQNQLQRIARNAKHLISGSRTFSDFRNRMFTKHANQIPSHASWNHIDIDMDGVGFTLDPDEKEDLFLEYWLPALWEMPLSHLTDYEPSVSLVKETIHLSLSLAANGAIVPQLFYNPDTKKYRIRWLPAMISEDVKSIVDQIDTAGYILFEQKPIESQPTIALISCWLTIWVRLLSEYQDETLLDLFFNDHPYKFDHVGESSIPYSIQQWLQSYYFSQKKYQPRIVVNELKSDRFQLIISVVDREAKLQMEISVESLMSSKEYDSIRYDTLQSLARLNVFVPGLDYYLQGKGKTPLILRMDEFTPFLMDMIPVIRLLGIQVLLPKSLQSIIRPKATIRIKTNEKSNGILRLDHLLDFDWQVAVGDSMMSKSEFDTLFKKSEGLIKTKAGYVYVDQKDLEHLHHHFTNKETLSSFDKLKIALSEDYKGTLAEINEDVKKLITRFTRVEEMKTPGGIKAALRPYQARGFSWLYRNTMVGFGSILADDMGLGKTLQVITLLHQLKDEGKFETGKIMIVVPTGLLTNWQMELEKFAPAVSYKVHHGGTRYLEKDKSYDILLTSYGVMRSDADMLKKSKWLLLIADEAQNIKNAETQQSKMIKSIPAHAFIAMSGTPVENRLSEMWNIVDFCNRGYLGSLSDFRKNYALPIQNQNDLQKADKLKKITGPILLRRLKSDKSIILDLPEKIEMDCFSILSKEQAVLYEKVLEKAMKAIEDIKTKDHQSLFKRQGLVLQLILALKQICNHPGLYLKDNKQDVSLSGKAELLMDKIGGILEANEKVLIFTQFAEMGHMLQDFIKKQFQYTPMFLHGGCTINQRKEIVNTFQQGPSDKILLLSLKAAGTGLNLTAANHVIHYDLWWNPAVESQATDRAYRIGQNKNVMVHRFITKNTFEEKINEMIQHKKKLANLTVTTGENWIGNLSNKELKELFATN